MKRKNSILMVIFVFAILILTSCSDSVKGKWSEEDKEKFRTEMESIPELSALGEFKTAYIECFLSKCEANYSSFFVADRDEKGAEALAIECAEEIISVE